MTSPHPCIAIVGGGPAGLMAAEVAAREGATVDLFDAMPSVGRKFLLAGKGGLNLTHGEPIEPFLDRYGDRRAALEPLLRDFGPAELRAWAAGLGIATFVGSSGRVFPTDLKAAPLLRRWLHRLRESGVRFHMRHRWTGLTAANELDFDTPAGPVRHAADAVVFALGGASWPQLGSDGAWVPALAAAGAAVAPLRPSNCGFEVEHWSEHLRSRFAGAPLKNVALRCGGFAQRGEFVLTETGIEGQLVYAASSTLRDAIERDDRAVAEIDLLPEHDAAFVLAEVARPRGSRSLSTHLKSRLGLDGAKAALLHECLAREAVADPVALARGIKALPIVLTAPRPIAEAISSAGGVRFESLDEQLMLRSLPGVFVAGEMLDWEAPTGGYLLTACFATGVRAAQGAATWLCRRP